MSKFFCLVCKRVFGGTAPLALHQFKIHGRLTLARYFVQGTRCEACLKDYNTHTNLINHVGRKTTCLNFYQCRGSKVEADAGVNSRKANAARSTLPRPFQQSEGPRPLCPEGPALDPYVDAERDSVWTSWEEAFEPDSHSVDQAVEALRLATLQTTLTLPEILAAFRHWCDDWSSRNEDRSLICLQIFAAFELRASGEWFLQGTQIARIAKIDALAYFEQESLKLTALTLVIPRTPKFAQRIFAHLFSGRRREGDVQQCLEKKEQ